MRKFTLFFALMVAMVTTAFAQGTLDLSKEYYLKGSYSWGMNSGYLTIGTKSGSNYGTVYMNAEKKQSFTLTAEGTDGGYKISVEQEMGGMSWTEYLNCETTDYLQNNAQTPSVFYFVPTMTAGKYNIKNSRGGFLNAKMITDGTYTANHVFCIGKLGGTDDIIEFELVPAGSTEPEVPAGVAPVIQTIDPVNGAVLSSVSKLVITFDKAIKSANDNGGMSSLKIKTDGATTRLNTADANINGNTVTFNFAEIKTSGEWTIEIPAGFFVAEDNGVSEAATYKFTIDGPVTLEKTSLTQTAYSFEEIEISFKEEIAFVEGTAVEALEIKSDGELVATVAVEDMEIDEKSLILCFDAIAPADNKNYTVAIPSGFITKKSNAAMEFAGATFTYKLKVPFEVKNITPANGAVIEEPLKNIVVEFSKNVDAYNTNNLVLANNADNSTVALTGSIDGKILTLTPAAEVANGTYTLRQAGVAYSNGLATLASTSMDMVSNAPVYTITVDAFVQKEVIYTQDSGYQLSGVQLFFSENIAYETRDVYGAIYNSADEKVADLTAVTFANLYKERITFRTTTKITAPDTYKIVVNAGIISAADEASDKVYAGGEFTYTIKKRPVEITPIDPPYGDIENINWYLNYSITINYADAITVDTEKSVTMTVGETTYTAEVTAAEESWGYVISIAFDAEAEYAEGDYTLTIPAGLYTVNGTPNAKEEYEFTYAESVPLKVVDMAVERNEAGAIVLISFEFNQAVSANEEFELGGCIFMNYMAAYGSSKYATYYAVDETYAESALTTPGEYTLYVQQIVGFNTELAEDQQMSYILTIEEGETTAIDAVNAEAENAVIYDLTGRRVEKITKAGVYVINGVKKVVK